MATSSRWKDIDDKFCLCSICLEQLKEPKQLPCLHRYCRDCLNSIIQGSYNVIKCPECREEIQIPTNGVDGFKTDFYSKSLVEYVQIQQSLNSDEIRECYSCSNQVRVAAYCFKCNDFLCKECHEFHVTNKTLKDHQKHTLSLEDSVAKNISIEKLTSLRDAPRCHTHPEKISELYCVTCSNLPVCMTCVYGVHKGHNLYEVKTLAELNRGELNRKLTSLEKIEMDNKFRTPTKVQEKLFSNVNNEKEKAIKMHDEKYQKVIKKIQDIEGRIQQVKQERQNTEKKIFDPLKTKMEYEIQSIKKKYDEIFKVKKVEINDTFQVRESSLEKELAKLREKRKRLDREKEELLQSIQKQLTENVKMIERMSAHFENIKKRLETLNVMASSILTSDNNWSAVQCIPDMCTAATNLMRDLQNDFQQLTTLTDVTVNYEEYSFGKTYFTLVFEQLRNQMTINDPYRSVCSMTSTGDGNIVISGYTQNNYSTFIIVVDINGTLLRHAILNPRQHFGGNMGLHQYGLHQHEFPRYCEFLTQHEVAAVCETGRIGLYDVRNGLCVREAFFSSNLCITCIATDPINNHILVGRYNSRDVYVFDNRLNIQHILTLPEIIKWPRDITVSEGHLLVCDYEENKCYVTTMDRLKSKLVGKFPEPSLIPCLVDKLESQLVGEFIKPNLGGNNFGPISVCTDKNESVFALWWCKCRKYGKYGNFGNYGICRHYGNCKNSPQCYLVQYNHDGSQVLATKKLDEGEVGAPGYVDTSPWVVTVVETSQGEKRLATYNTQTVSLYDLITED